MKEMQKLGENPGPGSYDKTSAGSGFGGQSKLVPLNTISSGGFHQRSIDGQV